MATRRLALPAPARCWVPTQENPQKFSSRMWTVDDVQEALDAGMWFMKGKHDFATKAAQQLAGVSE